MSATNTNTEMPLAGVRILDLSRVLAGPFCTMMLADLGADVIKVENPNGGDETRGWGPPFPGGESSYFLAVNRNKRSLSIDLGTPEGKQLVLSLAASADILVENFKVGGAERLGVGYDAVRAIKDDIIYCSITGFGSDRQPKGRVGYDLLAQAESGYMSVTGEADGSPTKVGVAVADLFSGFNATIAILAALRRRDASGRGERIEVSLLDSAIAALANVASNALFQEAEPRRFGNAHPNIVPYDTFPTADGQLALGVGNDGAFARFCDIAGHPELAGDPRFSTNGARVENREELVPIVSSWLLEAPAEHWVAELNRVAVPAGKVRGVKEAIRAAAESGRAVTTTVPHPTAGEVELIDSPIHLSDAALRPPQAPPLLGQHSREILAELGLDGPDIELLFGSRIVTDGSADVVGIGRD